MQHTRGSYSLLANFVAVHSIGSYAHTMGANALARWAVAHGAMNAFTRGSYTSTRTKRLATRTQLASTRHAHPLPIGGPHLLGGLIWS